MTSRSKADLVKRLKAFVSTAAIFSMLFGLSGLLGWALNLPALVTWGDGTAMPPNAAACFLLAGLSLFLLREKDKQLFAQIRKHEPQRRRLAWSACSPSRNRCPGTTSESIGSCCCDLQVPRLPPPKSPCPLSPRDPSCCLASLCSRSIGGPGERNGRPNLFVWQRQ
jgi:hypothetical protein